MHLFQPTIEVCLFSVCLCFFGWFYSCCQTRIFTAKRDSGWALERMVHLFTQTLSQESEGKLILHFKVCFFQCCRSVIDTQLSEQLSVVVDAALCTTSHLMDQIFQMKCFTYAWNIFHMSNGERANRQCLERRGPLTKKLRRWFCLLHSKWANQISFLLIETLPHFLS